MKQTRDRYLSKKKIPLQTAFNKLNISSVPCELKNLNRHEHLLIFSRLLVKKDTIIHSGCFPKLQGAICNIPAETKGI